MSDSYLNQEGLDRLVNDIKDKFQKKISESNTIPSDSVDDTEQTHKFATAQQLQDIADIKDLVPAQATVNNKLADKDFVNSSISTATAEYKGTFNIVTDLNLDYDATEEQIAAAIATAVSDEDNNDYTWIQIPESNEEDAPIVRIDRYKYNGTNWLFEFTLNNSGFTSAQWAAINSGITNSLVTKIPEIDDKLDSNLGVSNYNKYLYINQSGNITPVSLDLENTVFGYFHGNNFYSAEYVDDPNATLVTPNANKIYVTLSEDNRLGFPLPDEIYCYINFNDYYGYFRIGSVNNSNNIYDKFPNVKPHWEEVVWNGFSNFSGEDIWSDGTHIYVSVGNNHYELNKSTRTWIPKTWNVKVQGYNIWNDGNDIYYGLSYKLDKATGEWIAADFTNTFDYSNMKTSIWSDGNTVYYSRRYTSPFGQYRLNKATKTWEEIGYWHCIGDSTTIPTFLEFDGLDVWYDGERLRVNNTLNANNTYIYDGSQCLLQNVDNRMTLYGYHVWYDNDNIYYTLSKKYNKKKRIFEDYDISQGINIPGAGFNGRKCIWSDGVNTYYSDYYFVGNQRVYYHRLLVNPVDIHSNSNARITNTSDLYNDGNGISAYSTEQYVNENIGNVTKLHYTAEIDSINNKVVGTLTGSFPEIQNGSLVYVTINLPLVTGLSNNYAMTLYNNTDVVNILTVYQDSVTNTASVGDLYPVQKYDVSTGITWKFIGYYQKTLVDNDFINSYSTILDWKTKTDTSTNWATVQTNYIPRNGEIIVYSDLNKIKIGDGNAYLVDLPFIGDDIRTLLSQHISDTDVHIQSGERAFWNNKLNYTLSDDELVLNRN